MALGGTDRRRVRQHRRHPTTRLTHTSAPTQEAGDPQPGCASRTIAMPSKRHHAISPNDAGLSLLMNDRGQRPPSSKEPARPRMGAYHGAVGGSHAYQSCIPPRTERAEEAGTQG